MRVIELPFQSNFARANSGRVICRLFICCAFLPLAALADEIAGPVSPQESLAHIELEPGLEIELVAYEPEVVDPIAIRFDEDGRLWAVEMRDYPHGPAPGEGPKSRIVLLGDRDGDGRYETSRVFADGLLFPTGLQPWKGGLIVTLAGEVMYLKDTDGDGTADVREVWYRGFTAENPQLRANHPRFAFDNRVYIANGLRGGAVVDARRSDGQKPLSISGRDFSFDPRDGRFEAVSGNGQFGLTFDDFGNRFVCNNRAPLQHIVLENGYLARNPFLAVPKVLEDVAAEGDHSHVYPLTAAWTTSNLHAGQFTAACGIEIYKGDLLGDPFRGNAFTCEPTGSLVHREVLSPSGVTFRSQSPHEGREFLASRDSWFRPVNLETGPDGALYVVDMYRAVIEHPQYMPTELQTRPDLRLGDDRGRIYRILPAGKKNVRVAVHLSDKSSAELAELLRLKNAWWRETAARLLVERQDMSVAPSLARIARSDDEPAARGAALWLLNGLKALNDETLLAAIGDSHARVREQGVALSESRLQNSAPLREGVATLAADADPRVRFRVALALGGLDSGAATAPLLAISLAAADDAWTRQAVATALPRHIAPLLLAALASQRIQAAPLGSPELELVRELATIVGARRDPAEIGSLLERICGPADRKLSAADERALLSLAGSLDRRGGSLAEMISQVSTQSSQIKLRLEAIFSAAREAAADVKLDENARQQKIELLAHDRSEAGGRALLEILAKDPSQTPRKAAAEALVRHADPRIGPALLESFASQTPAIRRAILDALVPRPERATLLLNAIASQQIARAELDRSREARLLQSTDAAVREQARKLLSSAPPAERQKVLEQYRAALQLKSDPRAGKELFRKHCSVCHHIDDVGVDVAPDISDSRVKTPEQLLTDILNPNQAIDNNYVSYAVATADGNVLTGIIAAETASSITLKQQENKSVNLLRGDIESIRSLGVSLMPEGLEKNLSPQDVADVISFVKNWRYLIQPIPGTLPAGK